MVIDRVEFVRGLEFKNLCEVVELIKRLENKIRCVGCYKKLSEVPYMLSYYRHKDGWLVIDAEERLWLYVICCNCKYQNALWKLLRQVEPIEIFRILEKIRSQSNK
ncbi:MAG: hypothetical protein Q9M37_03525 [Desulfonauticus sp.]|nr:hypothetical protein [Desulfonauticus sp.]